MSQLMPLEGLMLNLKGEITPDRRREYRIREDALSSVSGKRELALRLRCSKPLRQRA